MITCKALKPTLMKYESSLTSDHHKYKESPTSNWIHHHGHFISKFADKC